MQITVIVLLETSEATSLIINHSVSIHGDKLTIDNETILMTDITRIKYGWAPIQLDMYTIGSRYTVEVKTAEKDLKINLRSYFGISKKKQYEKFCAVIDALWKPVMVRLINAMIDQINSGETILIDKCRINERGIQHKNFLIEWDDLSYQKNYNKLTINSKSNSAVWSNLYYTETDNVHVLTYFLDWKFQQTS